MKDHLREAKLLRQKIRYAYAREEARKLNMTTKRYLRLRREVLSKVCERLNVDECERKSAHVRHVVA